MSQNPKIILVNGPPRSGKDTAFDAWPSARRIKFARAVKEGAHAAFGMDVTKYHMDYFEDVKDVPSTLFFGATPRQAYISFSEDYMKPLTGDPAIFGRLTLAEILALDDDVFIITDSGFKPEAIPLVEHYGAANVLLIRVHRQGCDYSNDSRNYIDLTDHGVLGVDLTNNDLESYLRKVATTIDRFVTQ